VAFVSLHRRLLSPSNQTPNRFLGHDAVGGASLGNEHEGVEAPDELFDRFVGADGSFVQQRTQGLEVEEYRICFIGQVFGERPKWVSEPVGPAWGGPVGEGSAFGAGAAQEGHVKGVSALLSSQFDRLVANVQRIVWGASSEGVPPSNLDRNLGRICGSGLFDVVAQVGLEVPGPQLVGLVVVGVVKTVDFCAG